MASSTSLNTPYLILTGTVIIAIVTTFAVFQPILDAISTTRDDIQTTQARLQERQAFLQTLDQRIAALVSQAQHEQQLNVVLPAEEATEDVLRVIQSAANSAGGTIQRVGNISSAVQASLNARQARGEASLLPSGITPLGYEIEFGGSYQQLRVFLDQLQRSPRLLDITNLEIRRNKIEVDVIEASLTLQFYRYG